MSGSPHACGWSEGTCGLPAAISVIASRRGADRSVRFALPYSRLRLANPVAPSGRPTLPANRVDSPSPARYIPLFSSTTPPERASLSWKFSTPAMASEPYWAAAPSRSTSTCRSAMAGMAEMSGPCEPNATPLPPCQSTIDERCRRLPLTSTSVWSGARLRSMAGRTTVDTPLIGWELVLNDGMIVRSWSFRSPAPWLTRSVADSTSTGTADAVALRGCAREPTTTVSSVNPAIRLRISSGDNSRASTSPGVIPSTRLNVSTSASVRASTCSCGSLSCGSATVPETNVVHAGTSTAISRVARHRALFVRVVSALTSRMSTVRFDFSPPQDSVAEAPRPPMPGPGHPRCPGATRQTRWRRYSSRTDSAGTASGLVM